MQNAWPIALRSATACARSSSEATPASTFLTSLWTVATRRESFIARERSTLPRLSPRLSTSPRNTSLSRSFSTNPIYNFQSTPFYGKLKPYRPEKKDQGLSFRAGQLSSEELPKIFGSPVPPPAFANRLLRILHARRVDGTLDIDPPPDVAREIQKYPYAAADGLKWLRRHYPIDEDAAILQRIEREEARLEKDNPAELLQRAEDLGLYKPQSGNYQAKLSDKEGDVFGQSQLEKIRAANIIKAEQEEMELDDHIQSRKEEIKVKQNTAQLQVRHGNEGAVEVSSGPREPNVYERWSIKNRLRATSKFTLDSPEIKNMTLAQRILPSLILVSTISLLAYLAAQYWIPPERIHRVWPNISLTQATIFTIVGANLLVWQLWRFPPAFRLLNKYFIVSTAYPYTWSMLGSMFSHQSFGHLAINMGFLLLLPAASRLHEETERAVFVGVWLSSGLWASWASLAFSALRRDMLHTSLGASGAVMGVLSAYCAIHADERFTIALIPPSWQEHLPVVRGWALLSLIFAYEILGQAFGGRFLFNVFRRARPPGAGTGIDHVGHVGGALTGLVAGLWWKRRVDGETERQKKGDGEEPARWFEKIFGPRPDWR